MRKKFSFSVLVAGLLAVITAVQVFAGATFDYGTLAPMTAGGDPPAEGEANWTAWWLMYPDGTPYEILTEDNTNADDGEDIGYSLFYYPDIVTWVLQIENFNIDPGLNQPPFFDPDPVYMMFGGLGAHSGTLWEYTIDEWIITDSSTNHGEVSGPFAGAACPTLYDPIEVEDDTTYRFFGAPGGTYHVYRSQNASGANNGASNGQYFYLMTVEDTDIYGNGTFIDNTTEESWYVVIQADPGTNEIIGCHSEPADPTAVRMGEFTANYDVKTKVVELAWETVSEFDIIGFNVLRGTTTVGLPDKINDELIYADYPGELNGSSYTIKDFDLLMGETYYYWVEIVGNDNPRENIGPQSVRAALFFFLPFFQ